MNNPIHHQWEWNDDLADDLARLIRLAIRADLDRGCDVTSAALLSTRQEGTANIVCREPGVLCGIAGISVLLKEFDVPVTWSSAKTDGDALVAGDVVGILDGRALDLLVLERTLLNYISYLSGIASLTRRYVDAVSETSAEICDTRKTIPPWRRLAKYAVRCGGGLNHRTGLFDAVLIKDNHLAALALTLEQPVGSPHVAQEAVKRARTGSRQLSGSLGVPQQIPLQIEVDTLEQFAAVLPAGPDLVLLDNFPLSELRAAVELRDKTAPQVGLEASGGISLDTVGDVARTGVERISIGRLTHSAPSLDLAIDWCW